MNPLLLQVLIGAGGFILGFIVATAAAGGRLRRMRQAAQKQADGLQEQLAIKRLRLRELEGAIESLKPDGPPESEIPRNFQDILAQGRTGPRRLASRMERTPDSAPPRV